MHWTDEQFWRSTPRLFFDMQETIMHLRGQANAKPAPEVKHVDFYDDLPPGFW